MLRNQLHTRLRIEVAAQQTQLAQIEAIHSKYLCSLCLLNIIIA